MPTDRRRHLGQYFTPERVVDFALDLLARLSRGDAVGADRRSVIDPSCGDGVFLRRALERGLVTPGRAFGLDRDPELPWTWRERGLAGPGGPWLEVGEGLLAQAICGRPVRDGAFDWVMGNPPYAGGGLSDLPLDRLAEVLRRYELAPLRWRRPPGAAELRRLPIEVLFVERFVRLCAEGGLMAVILPVGIFANQRWRFVREWLLSRVTLHAVVGLPRNTFRAGGITAKTCLLVARRAPAPPEHDVLLAEVGSVEAGESRDDLAEVLGRWERGEMVGTDRPWAIFPSNGP